PEVEERAEMILVTVSENDAGNVRPLLLGIGDLGEDQIDTGQVGSGKGDAEVDDDPGPVMRPALAVKGEIHANLADAAKRQKDQLVAARLGHCRAVATALK